MYDAWKHVKLTRKNEASLNEEMTGAIVFRSPEVCGKGPTCV
jgi:hypothetical protein